MEKNMETAIMGYIGFWVQENQMENKLDNEMEPTIPFWAEAQTHSGVYQN